MSDIFIMKVGLFGFVLRFWHFLPHKGEGGPLCWPCFKNPVFISLFNPPAPFHGPLYQGGIFVQPENSNQTSIKLFWNRAGIKVAFLLFFGLLWNFQAQCDPTGQEGSYFSEMQENHNELNILVGDNADAIANVVEDQGVEAPEEGEVTEECSKHPDDCCFSAVEQAKEAAIGLDMATIQTIQEMANTYSKDKQTSASKAAIRSSNISLVLALSTLNRCNRCNKAIAYCQSACSNARQKCQTAYGPPTIESGFSVIPNPQYQSCFKEMREGLPKCSERQKECSAACSQSILSFLKAFLDRKNHCILSDNNNCEETEGEEDKTKTGEDEGNYRDARGGDGGNPSRLPQTPPINERNPNSTDGFVGDPPQHMFPPPGKKELSREDDGDREQYQKNNNGGANGLVARRTGTGQTSFSGDDGAGEGGLGASSGGGGSGLAGFGGTGSSSGGGDDEDSANSGEKEDPNQYDSIADSFGGSGPGSAGYTGYGFNPDSEGSGAYGGSGRSPSSEGDKAGAGGADSLLAKAGKANLGARKSTNNIFTKMSRFITKICYTDKRCYYKKK